MSYYNHTGPPLILASGSRYRAELLRRLHLHFQQQTPAVDETPAAGEAPAALALRLARDKALAVATEHPGSIVIGSDQVASLGESILGKPGSAANARAQLERCSGHRVTFHTGLCVAGPEPERVDAVVEEYKVQFRSLSRKQIARYVEQELPLDCAGSFRAEGLGIALFEKLSGDDPNSLIGLPLIQLTRLLNQRGIEIP